MSDESSTAGCWLWLSIKYYINCVRGRLFPSPTLRSKESQKRGEGIKPRGRLSLAPGLKGSSQDSKQTSRRDGSKGSRGRLSKLSPTKNRHPLYGHSMPVRRDESHGSRGRWSQSPSCEEVKSSRNHVIKSHKTRGNRYNMLMSGNESFSSRDRL